MNYGMKISDLTKIRSLLMRRKRLVELMAEGLDYALLRYPKFVTAWAPTNFDRCAILASLHHPPGALRRRCPARACLGNDYVLPKQKDTRRCLFVLAGAEGLEPSARGFGDRCSTNWAIPLCICNSYTISNYHKKCKCFFAELLKPWEWAE